MDRCNFRLRWITNIRSLNSHIIVIVIVGLIFGIFCPFLFIFLYFVYYFVFFSPLAHGSIIVGRNRYRISARVGDIVRLAGWIDRKLNIVLEVRK